MSVFAQEHTERQAYVASVLFKAPRPALNLFSLRSLLAKELLLWGRFQGPTERSGSLLSPSFPPLQVNIVILVAVTRVISHISTDSYKIHGDPSAFK